MSLPLCLLLLSVVVVLGQELENCDNVIKNCKANYSGPTSDDHKRDAVCNRQLKVCKCHVYHCEEDWTCFQRNCFPIVEKGKRYCDVEDNICQNSCNASNDVTDCNQKCATALEVCNKVKKCHKPK